MLAKSEISMNKELDLVKFMRRMRLFTFATLALLNRRQQYIGDNLSTMLMRESSDFDDSTSDDGELNEENEPDIEEHSKKIFMSKDKVDQRFIKIFKIKRRDEDRKRLKLLANEEQVFVKQHSIWQGKSGKLNLDRSVKE